LKTMTSQSLGVRTAANRRANSLTSLALSLTADAAV
jgi:hypothetical protein